MEALTPRERLVAVLRDHALVIGEVTLTSGAIAQYYVDAKRAILRPDGFAALSEQTPGQVRKEIVADEVRRITILPGTPSVSLNETDAFVPSALGSLPYFHVDEPLADTLKRVITAGGTVVDPTEERPGYGYFALVLDSEGNGITLHSAES